VKQCNGDILSGSLTDDVKARLAVFADLLGRWNERINLVSQSDIQSLWPRHIDDSLQLLPHLISRSEPAIDLGSGAGFPGLILAIASGQLFHLVEADRRKAAFLREAARETQAPVVLHNARIEDVTLDHPSAVLTARALAPLPELLRWSSRLLATHGVCLFLKGRQVQHELTQARREWQMDVELLPSRTDAAGTILKISKARYVGPIGTP
jgi:16S rRNA (guanine527-N7)-methyltransferase